MRSNFLYCIPLLLLNGLSCQEPEEKEPNPLVLSIAELEPSFGTFSVKVDTRISRPVQIAMTKDGGKYHGFWLHGPDTIVTDWDIKPKRTYTWQAHVTDGMTYQKSSNPVVGTTGDTTSHAFTFSLTELGPSSSIINDVWIVDENNIWAVGEIRDFNLPDTTYNVFHWNGNIWEKFHLIFHLEYPNPKNDLDITGEVNGVYVTQTGRVWVVADNGGISYSDNWGKTWLNYYGLRGIAISAFKIWGNGSSAFHISGYNGGLLYYNGTTFTRLPKVTDLHLTDLCGNSEGVFVISEKYSQDYETPILQINGGQIQIFPNKMAANYNQQSGIWVSEKHKYLAAGDIFRYDEYTKTWRPVFTGSCGVTVWAYGVRGNSDVDYWICDEFSHLVHFNGGTWKVYPEVTQLGVSKFFFYRLAVKDNLMVAIGFANNRDYLITGKRQ